MNKLHVMAKCAQGRSRRHRFARASRCFLAESRQKAGRKAHDLARIEQKIAVSLDPRLLFFAIELPLHLAENMQKPFVLVL